MKRLWISDKTVTDAERREDPYRERLRVDRLVQTTHAVDCGGGCTFLVGIRDGRICFERPAGQERNGSGRARACAAGFCTAALVSDPGRVSVPVIRGRLLEAWHTARRRHDDPVKAWESVLNASAPDLSWKTARGLGGFKETNWETIQEIIAAAVVHSVRAHGPESVAGANSYGSHSLVASASGRRFLHLLGGRMYRPARDMGRQCPAAEESWGEGVDTCEAEAWGKAALIAVMGFDPCASMSPDAPRLAEAALNGTRIWVLDDVLSATAAHTVRTIRVSPKNLAPLWMSVTHGILSSAAAHPAEGLEVYLRDFTDTPLLVRLETEGSASRPGPLLRACDVPGLQGLEQAESKYLIWNQLVNKIEPAPGSAAYHDSHVSGRWNLLPVNPETQQPQDPALSFLNAAEPEAVLFEDPVSGIPYPRMVPCRKLRTHDGQMTSVTTVLDILYARFGIDRGLKGDCLTDPDDPLPCTPAWAAQATSIDRLQIQQFIRDWLSVVRDQGSRCLVLSGWEAGLEPSARSTFSAVIQALVLSGCAGRPGGGLAYYSGQRKIHPLDSWNLLAGARDWAVPPPAGEPPPCGENRYRAGAERVFFVWDANLLSSTNAEEEPKPGAGSELSGPGMDLPAAANPFPAPDLLVDLNFRIDETALQADIVLPTATWYEKADLNCAETTNRIQAVNPAIPPSGQSRSEWAIFRLLADAISRLTASAASPSAGVAGRVQDTALCVDVASTAPGTGNSLEMLSSLGARFRALGPLAASPAGPRREVGQPARESEIDPLEERPPALPLEREEDVCSALLQLSAATHGTLAAQGFAALSRTTGIDLSSLVSGQEHLRITWEELRAGPAEPLSSPLWSGSGRAGPYCPFTLNHLNRVPWRTPTGRQQVYHDARLPGSPGEIPPVTARANREASQFGKEPDGALLQLRPRLHKWDFNELFLQLDSLQNWFQPDGLVWISSYDAARLSLGERERVELESGGRRIWVRCVVSRSVPRGCGLIHPRHYLLLRDLEKK